MLKRLTLFTAVFLMVLIGAGCSPINQAEESSSIKLIIVTRDAMSIDEIGQKIAKTLAPLDQNVIVDEVEVSEDNKYLLTNITKLTEDEIVSALESEDWINTVEINYELKMY